MHRLAEARHPSCIWGISGAGGRAARREDAVPSETR
jgi:hypothetical protein